MLVLSLSLTRLASLSLPLVVAKPSAIAAVSFFELVRRPHRSISKLPMPIAPPCSALPPRPSRAAVRAKGKGLRPFPPLRHHQSTAMLLARHGQAAPLHLSPSYLLVHTCLRSLLLRPDLGSMLLYRLIGTHRRSYCARHGHELELAVARRPYFSPSPAQRCLCRATNPSSYRKDGDPPLTTG